MPQVFNKHHGNAPKNAVYVGRGTPFGNRFIIGKHGNRDQVCDLYEKESLQCPEFIEFVKRDLKGCDLVCFCAPKRCHADFLLKIANEE